MRKFVLSTGICDFDPNHPGVVRMGSLVLNKGRCGQTESHAGIHIGDYLRSCKSKLVDALAQQEGSFVLTIIHGKDNLRVTPCQTGYYVSTSDPVAIVSGDSLLDCIRKAKLAPSFESMVSPCESFSFEGSEAIPDWCGRKAPWVEEGFEEGIRSYIRRMSTVVNPWLSVILKD